MKRQLKVNIAQSHEEAEEYDIAQMRSMTTSERFKAMMKMQEHVYGKNPVRVRDSGVYHIGSVKEIKG